MKRFLAIIVLLGSCASLCAAPANAAGALVRLLITTTQGNIEVVVDQKHAPITAKNFLHYVDTKFYNGGTFFRAVPGFVIQGGNKEREKPTDPKIKIEPSTSTGLRNVNGALSMARTADPDSATTEFFICVGDQPNLDANMATNQVGYAAFGHVTKGMDIVKKIISLPTTGDQLNIPIKIIKITRL